MTAQQIADFANQIEPRLIAQMSAVERAQYASLTREQRAELMVAAMISTMQTLR